MGDINILSKQVSELIAAGEVIERPSSVIKELVENAIDAQATSITVEIKNGGITFMRVTDNGRGIKRDDVKNAFLRHATSKISKQDDLENISTLGFRGEALASICAVSKVEIMTKNIEEDDGTRYELLGGEETSFDIIGCPQGTTFIVRDLFYNIPARMKFLKKDVSEGNSISNLLDRISLSHPEVSFTFLRDGKQILKTAGDNKLKNAVFQVFGKEFTSTLIPLSYEYSGIKIDGYISTPVSTRANRTMQLFFINGRYVRTQTAMVALEQAYRGSIMTGKFPACILRLEMNCSSLDVNVHPSKLEVRFTNEKPVYDCVYHAVKSALLEYDTRNQPIQEKEFTQIKSNNISGTSDKGVQLGFSYGKVQVDTEPEIHIPVTLNNYDKKNIVSDISTQRNIYNSTTSKLNTPKTFNNKNDITLTTEKNSIPQVSDINKIENKINSKSIKISEKEIKLPNNENFLNNNKSKNTAEISIVDEDKRETAIKYIGEAFSTYIILEYGSDRIMFIDKHAAHERLIYEKLKQQHKTSQPQILLEPITVTLDKSECETVLENREILYDIGFEVDDFGNGTIIIRSVPTLLKNIDIAESFLEIADYLHKHKKLVLSEKMEWIYQNTACRSAVKAGNISRPQELINLVVTLEKNTDVKYCPHGRPIYFFMSKKEVEKNFKRIV